MLVDDFLGVVGLVLSGTVLDNIFTVDNIVAMDNIITVHNILTSSIVLVMNWRWIALNCLSYIKRISCQ